MKVSASVSETVSEMYGADVFCCPEIEAQLRDAMEMVC